MQSQQKSNQTASCWQWRHWVYGQKNCKVKGAFYEDFTNTSVVSHNYSLNLFLHHH
jgi:hypothetical protein